MSLEGLGRAMEGLASFAIFSFFVLMPLAIWKAVEIIIWLFNHVRIQL